MIPSHSRVERPWAEPDLVLNEQRLLAIDTPLVEAEERRCTGGELRGIGDPVPEPLAHRSCLDIHTGFPLMRPRVRRDGGLQIQLAKSTVLFRRDRRGG